MLKVKNTFGLMGLLLVVSCGGPDLPESVQEAYEKLPGKIDFNQHVKPILSDKCFICHGPDEARVKAGLQLHLQDLAYSQLKNVPGKYAIRPGNPGKSMLIDRILSEDPEYVMPEPESHLTLTPREKAMLFKWIENGAEYADHWAFISPNRLEIPSVSIAKTIVNPIDNFIQARLEKEGFPPSKAADKEMLLRRVSFDLTGLPPSLEEIEAFLKDNSPNAYEKVVDRLLASPHYGEQRTLEWMDVSRYADTHGYTVDRYRDVSPWRDWVINAFNKNMPYDQFLEWQVAGDMMPNPTNEQVLATTFNRLHPQNAEGGIIDEEFRSEYVADRTNTVGEGIMGLTMACAKCHDHKYDPISQKNYYEMYSFFNNVNESGQISFDFSMPGPNLMLPTEHQQQFMSYINRLVNQKKEDVAKIVKNENQKAEDWIAFSEYKKIDIHNLPNGLLAQIDFNSKQLINRINPLQKGVMRQQFSGEQSPKFTEGFTGNGLKMDGDTWLHLEKIGSFQRHQPFSIGIRLWIPEELETGVIFHKGVGAKLYNFRGYHLALKNSRLELVLAHLHPMNAIIEESVAKVPKGEWIQLTMTYDGSSMASGLKVFLNGTALKTHTVVDNLYKDILFNSDAYGTKEVPRDPGLQMGARWRGKGIGGAIIDDILVFNRELTPLEVLQISDAKSLSKLISKSPDNIKVDEKEKLRKYYMGNYSLAYKDALNEFEKLKKTMVDSTDHIQEIMVMKEMPNSRKTTILERGQYDMAGEEVFPNTPERIFAFSDSLPKNRLGLAKWVTHKNHPLTARVAVNRYWQHLFGTGIVKTAEDFGNQGELPSHPALLDWLAIRFVESGWDVKALFKLIVTSHTYRQTSLASKKMLQYDKENRLLARGPSKRLSGEMLRNNVLVASGLMNRKIGGPSVKPYQPEGLWKINGAAYEEDKGEKLYRRSMYTIWKRSVPHPTIATFDAPDRSICTVRRQETNTPLQALVLLNDPIYVEASRVLGQSMLSYSDPREAISKVFKKLTGRTIESEELQVLLDLQLQEYGKFKENRKKTEGWLNTGEFKTDNSKDAALIAANAVVASTIINSDAVITKR